jgi:hypothetical protein
MNPERLKTRLKFVQATPLKNRAAVKTMTRREVKNINKDLASDPNDKFDTFFDYEEELSGMQSSSEQFAAMEKRSESLIMEDISSDNTSEIKEEIKNTFIVMEKIKPIYLDEKPAEMPIKKELDTNKQDIEKSAKFKFVRCDFIKDDGNRCKKQAPKNGTTCSVHRKLLKKRIINESV